MAETMLAARVLALAVAAGCSAAASAGVQTFDAYSAGLGAGGILNMDRNGRGGDNGFDPRGGGASVVDNDTASIQLVMFGSAGTVMSINTLGPISVRRAQSPVSIGGNRNGQLLGGSRGSIMASWDEVVGATSNTINVTIFSSDGQDLMPLGVFNPASPSETFDFWTWNFGVTDPVTWRNNAPAAPLISAEYKLSTNGGQTFFSSKAITNLPNPWPGVDPGTTQGEPGNGVNFIKISYKVGQVPAPGAMVLVGMCTLGAARRRRR